MTDGVSGPGGHPDAGTIAAHVERRLAPAEAARLDAHLAGCSSCREAFAETVRFLLDEESEPARAAAPEPARVLRLHERPAVRMAAALALAAGLVLSSWLLWRARQTQAPPSLVADLVQAVGEHRFVEPRLTGGFRYARFVRLRAADAPRGLDAQPPPVIAAVARVRERAAHDSSPRALAALAVSYLVSGDANAAVEALESATAQAPQDPRLQSDLSAAYLVRASRQDQPSDVPKGLEAAERSIALPNAPVEAWFNRALALEHLHLEDAARKAWHQYLERDPRSPWADEARKRLADLAPASQSSIEDDRARVRQALDEGKASLDRLAAESPAIVRDFFDNELLGSWAKARLANGADERSLRERATLVAAALLRATGDALPRDAARAMSAPASATCHDPPCQARGYVALAEAQRRADLLQASCDGFREARELLSAGGSPYVEWARERVANKCLVAERPGPALDELRGIERVAGKLGYLRLLGRAQWLQGLLRANLGEYSAALELYRSARSTFTRLGEVDAEAFTSTALAEILEGSNDERSAWVERTAALELASRMRQPLYLHSVMEEAAIACLDARLLRASLHLQDALVERERRRPDGLLADSLARRAAVHDSLGACDRSVADLSEARRWLALLAEPHAERMRAELAAAEGAHRAACQPQQAIGPLKDALAYFGRAQPARVPVIRQQLAEMLDARGSIDEAEQELKAGIELLESQRVSLHDVALQASFFEQAVPLFDDMVRLQVDRRRDPAAALSFVERGRGLQLLDALNRRPALEPVNARPESDASFRPEALQSELPRDVGLVYYVCLRDRLLAWRLSRDGMAFADLPVAEAQLSELVAAQRSALENRAPLSVVRGLGARLHDVLLKPLLPMPESLHALVFVPDAAIQRVSFAALWDARASRYLAEQYAVSLSPSGRVLTEHRATPPRGDGTALVIGNPDVDARSWPGLAPLPAAEREASEVAALYARAALLTGRTATKAAFLAGLRTSDIVHYAGHAVSAVDDPARSRLFLAPDAGGGDSGALDLRELPPGRLRARVVVLAACRSAAGAASRGEGPMSLSRPFLAAGVPAVVGSLWDVDDDVSRRFFVAFHRKLLVERDPARALNATQGELLRAGDSTLAHPASWAGFVSAGRVGTADR